jgi:predicted DNA-binding WGR domain protein
MIYLERHDPERNLYRFYRLSLEKNLFGEWSLVREWGRIGKPGQRRVDLCSSLDAAQAEHRAKLHEKQRRGYHSRRSMLDGVI